MQFCGGEREPRLRVLLILAVAGGAFAADFGGGVIGKVTPIKGSTEEDSNVETAGGFGQIRLWGSAENEEGTFGSWVRFNGNGGFSAFGYVWWKPLDMLQFQIGANPDGHFGVNDIVGWGFYAGACDVDVATEGWKFGSFFGGYGSQGAIITLTPMDALAINIGIPFIDQAGLAEKTYKRTTAQVAYTIDGIGRIAVTYAGNLMGKLDGKTYIDKDIKLTTDEIAEGKPTLVEKQAKDSFGTGAKIYASFLLTAVENLGVNIGLGYTLPVDNDFGKRNAPLGVGLGAEYNAGSFGVKARVQGTFMGTQTLKGGAETKDPVEVLFDVLPSFGLDDTFRIYLSAGIGMTMPDVGDTVVGWHVNPYLSKDVGGGTFYAGIDVRSDGGDDAVINWRVPIGMMFFF